MTTPTKTTDTRPISAQLSDPEPGDRWTDLDPMSDPILDRLPQQRGKRQVRSVLAILDQLNREERTR